MKATEAKGKVLGTVRNFIVSPEDTIADWVRLGIVGEIAKRAWAINHRPCDQFLHASGTYPRQDGTRQPSAKLGARR